MGEEVFILCSVKGDLKYSKLPCTSGEVTSCGWETGELQILRSVKEGTTVVEFDCVVKHKETSLLSKTSLQSHNIVRISRAPNNPSRCTIQLKTGFVCINKAQPSDVQLLVEVLEEIKRTSKFCSTSSTQENPHTHTEENLTPANQRIITNMKKSTKKKAKKMAKAKDLATIVVQEKAKKREPLGDLKNVPRPKQSSNQLLFIQNEVINKLWHTDVGKKFQKPLEWCITGAEKPMDLGTIKQRLEINYYTSAKHCIADMELMVNNVNQFCQLEDVKSSCCFLYRRFKYCMKKMPDEQVESIPSTTSCKKSKLDQQAPANRKAQSQDNNDQLKYLFDVVEKLWHKGLSSSWPFCKPLVNTKTIKDYHEIVKRPMDFGTIRGNLMRDRYDNASECIADINQVFTNCYLYNRPNAVERARTLEKLFLTLKADMPEKVNHTGPEKSASTHDGASTSGVQSVPGDNTRPSTSTSTQVQKGIKRKAPETISSPETSVSSADIDAPHPSKVPKTDDDYDDSPDSPLPVIDFGHSLEEIRVLSDACSQEESRLDYLKDQDTQRLPVTNFAHSRKEIRVLSDACSQEESRLNYLKDQNTGKIQEQENMRKEISASIGSSRNPSLPHGGNSKPANTQRGPIPSAASKYTAKKSPKAGNSQRKSVPSTHSTASNWSSVDRSVSVPQKIQHSSLSSANASATLADTVKSSNLANTQRSQPYSTSVPKTKSSAAIGNTTSSKLSSAQRMSNQAATSSATNSIPQGFVNSKPASVQKKPIPSTVSSATNSSSPGVSNSAFPKPKSTQRMPSQTKPSSVTNSSASIPGNSKHRGPYQYKATPSANQNQRAHQTKASNLNAATPLNVQRGPLPSNTSKLNTATATNVQRGSEPLNTSDFNAATQAYAQSGCKPANTSNFSATAPANVQGASAPATSTSSTNSVSSAAPGNPNPAVGSEATRPDMNNNAAINSRTVHTSGPLSSASSNTPFNAPISSLSQQAKTTNPATSDNDTANTATSIPPHAQASANLLESFREELSCAICTEELKEPKDLECNHTFCRLCLRMWLFSQANQKSLPCPVCSKRTTIPEAGIKGLKTNLIIKNLVDQVRSAIAGSPPKSQCKIHEGMVVQVNCKTCEQLVCEKCVWVCKRLDHTVEDGLRSFVKDQEVTSGRLVHPLNEKKRRCLVHLAENRIRCNAWNEQICQIKDEVKQYGDKLKESIDKDVGLKMNDIQKLNKEGEDVFATYEDEIKAVLVEVDHAISKQAEMTAATLDGGGTPGEGSSDQRSISQAANQSGQRSSDQRSVSQAANQSGGQASFGQAYQGAPVQPFTMPYPVQQNVPGWHGYYGPPGQMQQGWQPPGPGLDYQGRQQGILGAMLHPQVGAFGWPGQVDPTHNQGWARGNMYHGHNYQGRQDLWQQNPFSQPTAAQEYGPTSAGNSGRQPQPGSAVARQPNPKISALQREVVEETEKVLKKDLPSVPSHRTLQFVASGHHQQEFPIGQLVLQWW